MRNACRFSTDLARAQPDKARSYIYKRRNGKTLAHQAVTRRSRLFAVRSKKSAWLATAETVAGWNGLAIKKAGSGRSPVRKRSGYAVMKITGASKDASNSLTASSPELPSAS